MSAPTLFREPIKPCNTANLQFQVTPTTVKVLSMKLSFLWDLGIWQEINKIRVELLTTPNGSLIFVFACLLFCGIYRLFCFVHTCVLSIRKNNRLQQNTKSERPTNRYRKMRNKQRLKTGTRRGRCKPSILQISLKHAHSSQKEGAQLAFWGLVNAVFCDILCLASSFSLLSIYKNYPWCKQDNKI